MFKDRKIIACYLLILLLIFIYYFPATAGVSADPVSPKEITVVSDDNYPPYIFRDENGHLQGILVDEWQLWEKKTGIKVDLRGMDWDKAQKTMAEGDAQVIDTIFFTEERAKKLVFTAPYASIDVPIFFHNDISGIKDVKSLRGFTIGVKAGDACIDFLKKNGITTLQEFPSYESIIQSAMEHKVNVFCIDAPPALYFLNKMNIAKNYRHTEPLYTGQFHRAVPIEKKDLLAIVEGGFARISQKEHEDISKRWFGTPIPLTHYLIYSFYLMGALVLLGAILLLWNYTLRRKVAQKTIRLSETIDAMQKSEEKYRLVVENADEAILIAQDGLMKYVNPMTLKTLGYSEDLLTSSPFIEIIHPEDRERLFEAHIRRMRGEETQPVTQFRVIARDGTFKLADSHAVMISWEGKPATLNYITDITERKRAEEALIKSEEKYRTIIENIEDGYHEVDLKGNFTFFNESMHKIMGYEREDLLGMNNRQYADEENTRKVYQVYNQVYRTGEPVKNFEWQIIRKDGDRRDIEVSISLIRNTEGHPTGFRGIVRDTTERRQAEEALQRSEALLSASQKIAHLGSWELNLDSNKLTWSDEIYCIFGLEPQEFAASYEAFLDAVHPEDRAAVDAAYTSSILEGRDSYEIEHRIVLRNTLEIRFVYEKCVHLKDASGRIVRSIGMVQDITDRKQAEEERRSLEERLQRSEKMESLGILAGGVAHDLNNVLGIVVGYAEMLLMGADKSSPIRSKLVNIMEGGQKAAMIVGDLLTLARRGVSGREVLNLNKIIADWQQSPESEKLSSYHSAIKINTDLDPDLLNISASSVHLGKTIFNLVSNASEAMPKGGVITIKTANQYLDKPIQGYDKIQEGDYVILSVSDTGEGINPYDMKRIFEPFYTKKVMGRSGTGLGLAVVWGTVKDHNGYINVESEEGKGSTFTLYFPVTREKLSSEYVALSIFEYLGKGESILVVDDVKGQRDLAEDMLKKLNYSVTSVSSGEEAVAYLKEHKADLLVLDMIMDPGMDGLDTYRSILGIYPKQKAIIVSGFSESDRVKATQALGAGAYVRKPYIIEKLGLAVKKELDRST